MVGIYKIISPTNKVYIGQSWNIDKRWNTYRLLRCKAQILIYRSLIKYGYNQHKLEVLLELDENITQDYLDHCEQFFMDYYREEGFEMMNLKGAGSNGKYSKQSKEKMSNSQKERFKNNPVSEETKEKQKGREGYWKGKNLTEEIKIKMRKTKVNKIIKTCPYCNLIGSGPNMTRYHFNNCKKNNDTNDTNND